MSTTGTIPVNFGLNLDELRLVKLARLLSEAELHALLHRLGQLVEGRDTLRPSRHRPDHDAG